MLGFVIGFALGAGAGYFAGTNEIAKAAVKKAFEKLRAALVRNSHE